SGLRNRLIGKREPQIQFGVLGQNFEKGSEPLGEQPSLATVINDLSDARLRGAWGRGYFIQGILVLAINHTARQALSDAPASAPYFFQKPQLFKHQPFPPHPFARIRSFFYFVA